MEWYSQRKRRGETREMAEIENKLYSHQLEQLNYGLTSIVNHYWLMLLASTLECLLLTLPQIVVLYYDVCIFQ